MQRRSFLRLAAGQGVALALFPDCAWSGNSNADQDFYIYDTVDQRYPHFLAYRHSRVFDNYAVDHNNQSAISLIREKVLGPPGDANLCLIYGGCGMGKTHLMQAASARSRMLFPDRKATFVHSEKFIRGFYFADRHRNSKAFLDSFTDFDILFVEDLQLMKCHERAQYAFHDLLQKLLMLNKKVVVTQRGTEPQFVQLIGELYRNWNFVPKVELRPLAHAARCDVLAMSARGAGRRIPDRVLGMVSSAYPTNQRQMLLAINYVIGSAEHMRGPISTDYARSVLGKYQARVSRLESLAQEAI